MVPASIEGAVPNIREWQHATLPRALADDDVQRVLAAVDETRPNGRLDRAILLLLSRLGLRAGEAAVLTVAGDRLVHPLDPFGRVHPTGAQLDEPSG